MPAAYHYHAIFGDICSARFSKLARFVFFVSWALSLVLSLRSSKSWWTVTLLPVWALPHFLGFVLVLCLRKNNLHVDHLGYRTLASQVLGQLLNRKFALNAVFYALSSLIFFLTLQSQYGISFKATAKKHQYPPLSDKYVFYYFYSLFVSTVYALQHSIFDKDRLVFTYGSFHAHPKTAILNKLPVMFSNTILFSITSITSAPFVYLFVRYMLYDVTLGVLSLFYDLNNNYPSLSISLGFLFKLSITTSLLFLSWEVINTAFNAYMSIGCLHRGHPLSELSTDPLGTLLTGLKSEKPFTKLTAFQELAYIAKSDDPERRMTIYARNNKREFVWGEILQECERVIKTNNANIIQSLAQAAVKQPTPVSSPQKQRERDNQIFGREYLETERNQDSMFKLTLPTTVDPSPSLIDAKIIPQLMKHAKEAMALLKEYYTTLLSLGVGMPFRHTATREAEHLCPTPVIVGNAIIALSLFGTKAYSEDKRGTVSSTITDILEILEKSVSACGRFVQSPPAGLVGTEEENLITLLHELSMNAFYEVTLQYSTVLKDVVLPPDVYRLVQWTLETAMESTD